MKYNLSEPLIQKMSNSEKIWFIGMNLFKSEKVHIISGLNSSYVKVIILEKEPIEVDLHFDRLGDLLSHKCHKHPKVNICEHLVAALLQVTKEGDLLMRIDREELPWPFNDETISESIPISSYVKEEVKTSEILPDSGDKIEGTFFLTCFDGVKINASKQAIRIIPWLTFYDTNAGLSFQVKSGSHSYTIKDIEAFVIAIHENKMIEYGKYFTLDPSKYFIDKKDDVIFEFIDDMYQLKSALSENIFKKSQIILNESFLKKFIQSVNIQKTRVYCKKNGEEIRIVDRINQMNFDILLKEELTIDFHPFNGFKRIGDHGAILWYESCNELILLSENDRRLVKKISRAIEHSDVITVEPKYFQEVVNNVVPILNEIGRVNYDDTLKNRLIHEPLERLVYLDYKDKFVIITIIFKYGYVEINGLTNVIQFLPENFAVIRDFESENILLKYFEKEMYIKTAGELKLVRPQNIYCFLVEEIKGIEKEAKVFATKRFKAHKIIEPHNVKEHVRVSENKDYLEYDISIEGVESDDLQHVLRAYQEKRQFYQLKNGDFLNLKALELDEIEQFLNTLGFKRKVLGKPIVLPISSAIYIENYMREKKIIYDEEFKHLIESMRVADRVDLNLNMPLEMTLRAYQTLGVKWLCGLANLNMGGILADDMGLGKTLQVLAFIYNFRKETHGKKILIVAPTSLIYNWGYEIEKFAKELSYEILNGDASMRHKMRKNSKALIWITSYGSLRSDINEYESILFYSVILDEAQHIKNDQSISAKAVKRLKAENRFALTGTPIENHLGELWSIFDFILPGHLGTRYHFRTQFEKPLILGTNKESDKKLGKLIEPFIMRRLKEDVLSELPDKLETQIVVELTEEQKLLYVLTVHEIKASFDETSTNKRMKMLAGLTRLRQICSHPAAYLDNYHGGSGKQDAFLDLLDELLEGGHRIILFSSFTSVLKILSQSVDEPHFYLDGNTPSEERIKMVSAFNEGEHNLFFISLRAGGVGLNLTGADTVIHFDPWWNPAVEVQASDRAHRIGQEKIVHVIKFITRGTIEEKILDLQSEKQFLIDRVIKSGETFIHTLSEDELNNLFELQ